MSMIDRYNQISEEVENLWKENYGDGEQYCHKQSFDWGFQEGVEFAEKNPNWHLFPKEKPTDYYIDYEDALPLCFLCSIEFEVYGGEKVLQTEKAFYISESDSWHYNENDISDVGGRVVAWMELPIFKNE